MAGPAGLEAVLLTNLGVRIGARVNIVMSVTIRAGCYIGSSERNRFTVEGLAVPPQPVLVASAAFTVDTEAILWSDRFLDLVGRMALDTSRPPFVALADHLSVDAFVVDLFRERVTMTTGLGDVFSSDTRLGPLVG